MVIYLKKENTPKINKFRTRKQVSLFGKIHIFSKDSNLFQETSALAICRYLEYLKDSLPFLKLKSQNRILVKENGTGIMLFKALKVKNNDQEYWRFNIKEKHKKCH